MIIHVSRIWKRGERDVSITSHEKTVKFVNVHGNPALSLIYKKIYVL